MTELQQIAPRSRITFINLLKHASFEVDYNLLFVLLNALPTKKQYFLSLRQRRGVNRIFVEIAIQTKFRALKHRRELNNRNEIIFYLWLK